MNKNGIFRDPGFYLLIGINVYLVYYYYHHPQVFTTLIWLYWAQSVLLGIFNFFDMLTVRKVKPGSISIDAEPNTLANNMSRPGAFFFLVHYGFFHFVYLIFIAGMKRSGPIDWYIFKYFFLAFLLGQVITFIQHKIQQRTTPVNLGAMFFVPYLRILPMHLTIILPNFMAISNLGIFLILKAFADVVMYAITKPSRKNKDADTAYLASQQTLNM